MSTVATVAAALERAAANGPDRPYVRLDDGELSFGALFERAAGAAGALKADGLSPGDRVVIITRNEIATVVALFACALGGFVAVPINPAHEGPILAYLLADSDPARIVCSAGDEHRPELVATGVPLYTGPQLLTAAAAAAQWVTLGRSGQAVSIMYTSGTTGRSKGAVLPNGLYLKQAQSYLDIIGTDAPHRFFTSLPLFHTNAQCLTLMGSLLAEAPCRIVTRFSASGLVRQCADFSATVTNLLGAMVAMLLDRMPPDASAPTLRVIVGAGAAPEQTLALEQRLGVRLRQLYGLTEVGVCAGERADDTGDATRATAGRAMDGFALRIAGGALGADGAISEIGEIQVRPERPDYLFTEYWRNQDATRTAYTDDGWFRTGDLGLLDRGGRLQFHGRTKEVIRRRGENVPCADVEAVVQSSPDVQDCAAVAVASELAEDEIKLVYVPTRTDVTIADIESFCRASLPAFMVPRYYEQVDVIPRTPTFKVQRYALTSIDAATVLDTQAAGRAG